LHQRRLNLTGWTDKLCQFSNTGILLREDSLKSTRDFNSTRNLIMYDLTAFSFSDDSVLRSNSSASHFSNQYPPSCFHFPWKTLPFVSSTNRRSKRKSLSPCRVAPVTSSQVRGVGTGQSPSLSRSLWRVWKALVAPREEHTPRPSPSFPSHSRGLSPLSSPAPVLAAQPSPSPNSPSHPSVP